MFFRFCKITIRNLLPQLSKNNYNTFYIEKRYINSELVSCNFNSEKQMNRA